MVRTAANRQGEQGQVLPILLVAFVAVLAIGLVLFQVGSATDDRAQAQTAADAAALAGAKCIGIGLEQKLNGLTGPLGGINLATVLDGISGAGAARSYAGQNKATMALGGFRVVVAPQLDPSNGAIVLTVEASVISDARVPPPNVGQAPAQGSSSGLDAGTGKHANATAWAELDLVPSSGVGLDTSVSGAGGTGCGAEGGPVPTPPGGGPTTLSFTGRTRLVAEPSGSAAVPLG